MFNLEEEYNRLTDEIMGKICKVLENDGVTMKVETLDEIGIAVCDGTLAALHAGENCFSYKVAEQRGKVKIEGINGAAPLDGVGTHYYWAMKAGFAEQAEAEMYIKACREADPGTQYGLFIDGLPVDYD